MGKSLRAIGQLSPGQDLNSYIQIVNNISLLSAQEEQQLAKRLHEENDLDAARQLVMSHLRFVVHIARSYSGYGLAQADLIQEGNVGLMKAIKRFDPNQGVRLVSFAVHWIKAEIHEFVLRNWRIVKVATTKAQRKLFFNLRSAKKTLTWLNNDEVEAIARDLDVKPQNVREMESRLAAIDTAFDITDDDDDEQSFAVPANYLQDFRFDPAQQLEASDEEEQSSHQLMQALQQLDERSRNILQQRWLAEQKATLHELAAIYQISAERVRQLEKTAMQKIQQLMSDENKLSL